MTEKLAHEIIPMSVERELKQSYLDYAMSVIIGRALPDVRDGLKPVHRRVLFAMHELNNEWNKPHKKSARVVGDVIGKYHPHGDSAVYDTIVRMAQPFSLRYLLVDGQGNFGSVDGDAPAAMRYTEVRMSKLAHALLEDLDKETVEFAPNYDGSEHMPLVLPTRVPNLLVNGSSGIAVGMATNIPPHNLNEIIRATLALIDTPEISIEQLMKLVPGPDFPTAGIINGRVGIMEAYLTGKGRIFVRGKADIETDRADKPRIIITELPYQVNKARLLERIGELVREKRIEGITGLRDESDKSGMRVVIELRRNESPEVMLNNLYAQTQLQVVFGINMVALQDGQPQLLNLKQLLEAFVQHRREVVTRRSLFELKKARQRAHTLEGLGIALANIDAVIALIKAAANPSVAKQALLARGWPLGTAQALLTEQGVEKTRPDDLPVAFGQREGLYWLSPEQVQAILDLRLHRLTGLEQEKLYAEYQELVKEIDRLLTILADPDELHAVIRSELNAIQKEFGDARRTVIVETEENFTREDLIPMERVVVTLSHQGYVKTQALDAYQAQHRGGRGKAATRVKEADYIKTLVVANTHDTLLCFTNRGKVYGLKTYEIPEGSRIAQGRPVVNLLPLQEGEQVTTLLPVSDWLDSAYIFMVTALGTVKKMALTQFAHLRSSGLIAVSLQPDDELVGVVLTQGDSDIMLINNAGRGIRFHENEIRPLGRTAQGVRGMTLKSAERVIALLVVDESGQILTATERGYGQRTEVADYRPIRRGGQGVRVIQTGARNGAVIGAAAVRESDEVLLISNQGTLIRTRVSEISLVGRNTQGVRLIQLEDGESLIGLEPVIELPGELPEVEVPQ